MNIFFVFFMLFFTITSLQASRASRFIRQFSEEPGGKNRLSRPEEIAEIRSYLEELIGSFSIDTTIGAEAELALFELSFMDYTRGRFSLVQIRDRFDISTRTGAKARILLARISSDDSWQHEKELIEIMNTFSVRDPIGAEAGLLLVQFMAIRGLEAKKVLHEIMLAFPASDSIGARAGLELIQLGFINGLKAEAILREIMATFGFHNPIGAQASLELVRLSFDLKPEAVSLLESFVDSEPVKDFLSISNRRVLEKMTSIRELISFTPSNSVSLEKKALAIVEGLEKTFIEDSSTKRSIQIAYRQLQFLSSEVGTLESKQRIWEAINPTLPLPMHKIIMLSNIKKNEFIRLNSESMTAADVRSHRIELSCIDAQAAAVAVSSIFSEETAIGRKARVSAELLPGFGIVYVDDVVNLVVSLFSNEIKLSAALDRKGMLELDFNQIVNSERKLQVVEILRSIVHLFPEDYKEKSKAIYSLRDLLLADRKTESALESVFMSLINKFPKETAIGARARSLFEELLGLHRMADAEGTHIVREVMAAYSPRKSLGAEARLEFARLVPSGRVSDGEAVYELQKVHTELCYRPNPTIYSLPVHNMLLALYDKRIQHRLVTLRRAVPKSSLDLTTGLRSIHDIIRILRVIGEKEEPFAESASVVERSSASVVERSSVSGVGSVSAPVAAFTPVLVLHSRTTTVSGAVLAVTPVSVPCSRLTPVSAPASAPVPPPRLTPVSAPVPPPRLTSVLDPVPELTSVLAPVPALTRVPAPAPVFSLASLLGGDLGLHSPAL